MSERPTDVRMEEASQSHRRRELDLRVAMVVAVAAAILMGLLSLDTAHRDLIDTDGYMHAVRVTELLDGSTGWFDSFAPRSNAPYGHAMHWTRPMDLVVGGLALPLAPFVGTSDAVYWAGVANGPLFQLAIAFAVLWMAVPLVGRRWAPLAGLVAALAPGVSSYTAPGRVDHHALILLLTSLGIGAFLRTVMDTSERGWRGYGAITGGLLAMGLWTSTEFLMLAGLVGVIGLVMWIVRGHECAPPQVRLWGVATAGVAGALLLERGPGFASHELDRISLVHLLVVVCAEGLWLILARLPAPLVSRSARRLGVATVGVASVGAVVGLLEPTFFRGPFGAVPADLQAVWLSRVVELRPLLADGASAFGRVLGVLFLPAVGLAAAVRAAVRDRRARAGWVVLGVFTLVTVGLTFVQVRWFPYPQLGGAVGIVWLLRRVLERVWTREGVMRVVLLAGVLALIVFGSRLPVLALEQLSTHGADPRGDRCPVAELATWMNEHAEPGDIVLAAVDVGPELLYRSDVDVLAAPYHRDVDGILDAQHALSADSFAVLGRVVTDRSVRWIAICPGYDASFFDDGAVYRDLVSGARPVWLSGPFDAGEFVIWEVGG